MKWFQRPVIGLVIVLGTAVPALSATADPGRGCQPPAEHLEMSDLPEGSVIERCDLVGQLISDDGSDLAVPIPAPGKGVVIDVLGRGGHEEFGVRVSESGRIDYQSSSSDPDTPESQFAGANAAPSARSAHDQCVDTASQLYGAKQHGAWEWWLGYGTPPAGLTRPKFQSVTATAIANITEQNDGCGWPDTVSATADYQGSSTHVPGVTQENGHTACGADDDVSVVDAGVVPGSGGELAVTCFWFLYADGLDDIVEADILVDTNRYDFTIDPVHCSGRYDLQAVLTHEAGHVYGLGHVLEYSHPDLTMSEEIGQCDPSARTLGRGDVIGLRNLY